VENETLHSKIAQKSIALVFSFTSSSFYCNFLLFFLIFIQFSFVFFSRYKTRLVQSDQHRLSGHYASIYPNQHDLVLVRQQRDLFSGGPSPTLGIPDVTTRVGSVIHAFETLAQQRQQREAEKIYESSKSTSGKEAMHKIILPPPPSKVSTGTLTDPLPPKHIVRHRPKGRAPDIPTSSSATNTATVTTQTTKLSADENESSALDDSLNLDDDYRRATTNFPPQQSYVKHYKVLPPFVPPRNQPSRIPTKAINKASGNQLSTTRNRTSDSLLSAMPSSSSRTNVFLKSNANKPTTEEEIENDFLRGSTVSQSFIKNVVRKSPQARRKLSTYEQNFLINDEIGGGKAATAAARRSLRDGKSRSSEPFIDEVSKRYKEYSGNKTNSDAASSLQQGSSRQFNFQPRSVDRAEI
jgi:hypothetical protein